MLNMARDISAQTLECVQQPARSFAQEPMRSKPFRFTTNAAQANDSPREPEWSRGAFQRR
jgi:hypothetical protein